MRCGDHRNATRSGRLQSHQALGHEPVGVNQGHIAVSESGPSRHPLAQYESRNESDIGLPPAKMRKYAFPVA
jgi:hypothetical protein